jgi:hypothetical protein
MKKYMKLLACLFAGACVLAACDDDDPVINYEEVTVSDGLFILNEGSYFSQVNGSLDYLDFATGNVNRNVFQAANGRSLGGTPNNAIQCGSKIYITTQEENRVEVIDAKTLKAFSPIAITAPRELCTDGKCVYVSSYTGEVSMVDTLALKVVKKSPVVGTNLEGIAYRAGYVYVCNAWNNDYTYNTNVVKLNAETLQKEKDVTVVANPNQLIASGDDLYLASWGNYFDVPATIQSISMDDQVSVIAHATQMALGNGKLYLIGSSYDEQWNEVNSYTVLDLKNNQETEFIDGKEIISPCTIGVEPTSGDVFISSRQKDPVEERISYTQGGYIVHYKADGTNVATYDCGVNPGTLLFVSHTEKVPVTK